MQRGAGGLIGRKILYYLRPCKNFFQKKITACCVCVKKIVYLRKPYSERVYPEGVIPGRLRWLWNYRGCSADCEIFSGKIREGSGDFFIQCLLRSHFIEEERSRKYIIKKKEKERRNIGDEKSLAKIRHNITLLVHNVDCQRVMTWRFYEKLRHGIVGYITLTLTHR